MYDVNDYYHQVHISEDSPDNIEWTHFQHDLNNCSTLTWDTEAPSSCINFLDLTLWIDKDYNKLNYKTYQKDSKLRVGTLQLQG